jgi:hypothetical protein
LIERHKKKLGNIDICVADEAAIKAAAADPVLSKAERTPPIPSIRTLDASLHFAKLTYFVSRSRIL